MSNELSNIMMHSNRFGPEENRMKTMYTKLWRNSLNVPLYKWWSMNYICDTIGVSSINLSQHVVYWMDVIY